MTAAVVDGDPPLPPEHTPDVSFVPNNNCAENENEFLDDSFIFETYLPGTQGYGGTAVAHSNGRNAIDHDPQPQRYQSTTHLSLAPPPPRYDLKQLQDDIRRMCEGFVMSAPVHPSRSNDTITTTTTTPPHTIADIRQAIVPPASNTPWVRCIPSTDATTTSPEEKPTSPMMITTITTNIRNDDADDATTTTIHIDDDDDATTTTTTHIDADATTTDLMMKIHTDDDATTTTTSTNDDTIPLATIRTPWLRDSFSLVFQAADRLDAAIADMSSAIASMSASISKLRNHTPDSLTTPRCLTPPIETPQPTSQPRLLGPAFPNLRRCTLLPLPNTHPPFIRKHTIANMRPQPHPSPSFQAQLLRMAKHNYRPP